MRSPFPSEIQFIFADSSAFDSSKLHPDDLTFAAALGERRRDEFLLGRYAAVQACRALGVSQPPQIGRAESGAPIWPADVVGSISHKNKVAVAAAAHHAEHSAVGIDIERLSPRALRLIGRTAGDSEKRWINEDPAQAELRAMLLFSAKESVFKAVSPLFHIFLGFHDVLLEPGQDNRLVATVQAKVPVRLDVAYQLDAEHIVTGAYLRRPAAVRSPD